MSRALPDKPPGHSITPIDELTAQRRRQGWDDLPLRRKTTMLLAVAAVLGAAAGFVGSQTGDTRVLLLILTTTLAAVLLLAKHWLWAPLEQLVDQLGRLSLEHRPPGLQELPTARRDEVGQIARSVQMLNTWCIRDSLEARQLRRTLDDRVAQATRRATRQLIRLAMRDPLTDLGNRRFLDEQLEPLIKSAIESREDVTCVLLDMDNFKKVNDTLGHAAGDELITFLADLIRATVRKEDMAVRLGGDEFVLVMPGCPAGRAASAANHIAALFRQRVRAALPADCQASLSIGVASLTREGVATGRELLDRADANLYAAKRQGKDRLVGAE